MLAKRGTNTVRGMSILFTLLDGNSKARKADKDSFIEGLTTLGVALTKAEADVTKLLIL